MLRSCSSASGPGSPFFAASSTCCWLAAWLQSVEGLAARLCRDRGRRAGAGRWGGMPAPHRAAGWLPGSARGQRRKARRLAGFVVGTSSVPFARTSLHDCDNVSAAKGTETAKKPTRRTVSPCAISPVLRRKEEWRLSTTALVCSALFSCRRARQRRNAEPGGSSATSAEGHEQCCVAAGRAGGAGLAAPGTGRRHALVCMPWSVCPCIAPTAASAGLPPSVSCHRAPAAASLALPAPGPAAAPAAGSRPAGEGGGSTSLGWRGGRLHPSRSAGLQRQRQPQAPVAAAYIHRTTRHRTCTSAFFFFSSCTWLGCLYGRALRPRVAFVAAAAAPP